MLQTGRRRSWSLLLLLAGIMLAGCDGSGNGSGGEDPGTGGSKARAPAVSEQELLSRAIRALGGKERLERLRAVDLRFEAEGPGIQMRGRIRQEFPDRFRQEQKVWDAELVHVSSGEGNWRSIDGVPMALDDEDRQRLEEQVLLARLSLLFELARKDWQLSGRDEQDGLLWLVVRHAASGSGPWYLGFDPQTYLLSRVRYETVVYGQRSASPVMIEFSDYRSVSGVMIPFLAKHTPEGQAPRLRTRIVEIEVDPGRDDSLFEMPAAVAEPEVRDRKARSFEALVLERWSGSVADGEKRIRKAMTEKGFERTGPLHVLIRADDGSSPRIAYPVVRKTSDQEPPSFEDGLALRTISDARVLTTIVKDPDDEDLDAAWSRLAHAARTRGCRPSGGMRRVIWSEEITQVQLLVN